MFLPKSALERPRIIYEPRPKKTNFNPSGLSVDLTSVPADSQTWRFRNCQTERAALMESLRDMPTTFKGQQRFKLCGEGAGVFYDPDSGRYRVRTHTCGHRWCPACRQAFTRDLRGRLNLAMKGAKRFDFKFITLTIRSTTNPLRDEVDKLFKSFRRLRQTRLWQSKVQWGVAVLEITQNAETHLFHPHLHIICRSEFIPAKAMGRSWKKASEGSQNCDVRAIRNAEQAVNYVTKYVAKGNFEENLDKEGTSLIEKWWALKRKKMVLWFGNKPDLKEDEDEDSERSESVRLVYIGSLDSLLKRAAAGMPNACLIVKAIESGERGPPPDW